MDSLSKILGGALIAALIYIVFLQGCGTGPNGPAKEVVKIIHRDSTHWDTSYYDTTRFKYVTVSVPLPYYDTSVYYDTIPTYTENDFNQIMRYPSFYEDSVSDDTISIKYRATVRGYLDNLQIGYKIFKPYSIVETRTIETETVKAKRFNGFYFGINAGTKLDTVGLSSFTPMLQASWRNLSVEGGYDFIDGSIEVGVKRRLSFSRRSKPVPRP